MAPLGAVRDAALPLLLIKVPLANAVIAGSCNTQESCEESSTQTAVAQVV